MKLLTTLGIFYWFGVTCLSRALLLVPPASQKRQGKCNWYRAMLKYDKQTTHSLLFLSVVDNQDQNEEAISRTTFDEAGKSLIDEEDAKRMEAMGDYDLNPDSKDDKVERMRAAIRARTADLGIEKSKVSAEYIQQRQNIAISAGSARADAEQSSANTFAGLDLSRISDGNQGKRSSQSPWADEEDEPTMFFDPEEKLSEQERAEIDPFMKKGIFEQGLNELQNAKWPDWASALREVALMILVIAVTGVLIVGWDKVLRFVYTDVLHFIPSQEDLANYASRFDSLALPKGWTDNMNEADVAKLANQVNSQIESFSQSSQTIQQQIPPTFPDL